MRNRAAEVAAGREHFAAFRDWQAQGGLDALLRGSGAIVESERAIDSGALRVVVLSRNHS